MLRALSVSLTMVFAMTAVAADPVQLPIYFGTYTGGPSKGIYRANFNKQDGSLTDLQLVGEAENPSFLARHPKLPLIYSVSEVRAGGERKGAALIAWRIDHATGRLTEVGRMPSGSDGPCHVAVDSQGRWAAMANYSGGSVTLVALNEQGLPVDSHNVKHEGASKANPSRQEAAHAHCVLFVPHTNLLLVTDLGLDQVKVYRVEGNKLVANSTPFGSTKPGDGPRHMQLTGNREWLLVINELANTVSSYKFDPDQGTLAAGSSAPTLPKDWSGSNTTAEVKLHPNGKFVYGSNRGHDSIAVMSFDQTSGALKQVAVTQVGVKTPRNFNLVADGQWMIVVGQDSSDAAVFKVDAQTGLLQPVGSKFEVPKSVCVLP